MLIKKANKVHNNKYDYSLVNYKNNCTKIKIICPIHGVFEQLPNSHTSAKSGCPKCKQSKGEFYIQELLKKYDIFYIQEKSFKEIKKKTNKNLKFDFYLPNKNMCIEYQGEQHYIFVKYWGGKKGFINRIINDQIKFEFCKNNNIKLLEIPYWERNNIKTILKNQGII